MFLCFINNKSFFILLSTILGKVKSKCCDDSENLNSFVTSKRVCLYDLLLKI